MARTPVAVRIGAAALCAGLGVGVLATRSGAQSHLAHSSVFQSVSEASVLGAVYSRPGQLPTGDAVGAIGYSRTKVSILGTEGIGSYLWFGDLAAGFKEAAALQAGESSQEFKQIILGLPDYPFMAKAHTPGSDAERARSTSLTGSFDGAAGIVLDGGKASATADPDAASGTSVIAGAEVRTPNEIYRNAAAALRQQLGAMTGRTIAQSDPGIVVSAQNGRASSTSTWDGPRLVVTTLSQISGFSAFEGLVQISGIKANVVVTSDGRKPTAVPSFAVTGVTVGPFAARLDSRGLHINDTSLNTEQLRTANDALATQLATAGLDLRVAGESAKVQGPTELASATASGLVVSLDLERVFGRFRSQLPVQLQGAVAGDNLKLAVGTATSAGATAPDVSSVFGEEVHAPSGGSGASAPLSSVLGEQFGVPTAGGPTTQTTVTAPGLGTTPAGSVRVAGSVAYIGVPGWALLLGAAILLVAGAALSFLGVWQML